MSPDTGTPSARTRWLVHLVQVAVAAGLLVVVWRLADGGEALQLLRSAEFGWLIAAVVALTAQLLLSAYRWRLSAEQLGISMRNSTAVSEYYLAQLVNQVLPGGVVGDAGRAVRGRHEAGLAASGQAVLVERLAGQAGLFLVMSTAFLVTAVAPGGLDWPGAVALVVAGVIVVLAVAPPALLLWTSSLPGRVGGLSRGLRHSLWRVLAAPSVRWKQLGLSLATALTNILGFWMCAMAIGSPLSPAAALAIVPLILLTMLIPVTVSGWGLREGAAAALLPLAGLSAAEGLATSVAFGLVILTTSLPGLGFIRPVTRVQT